VQKFTLLDAFAPYVNDRSGMTVSNMFRSHSQETHGHKTPEHGEKELLGVFLRADVLMSSVSRGKVTKEAGVNGVKKKSS